MTRCHQWLRLILAFNERPAGRSPRDTPANKSESPIYIDHTHFLGNRRSVLHKTLCRLGLVRTDTHHEKISQNKPKFVGRNVSSSPFFMWQYKEAC